LLAAWALAAALVGLAAAVTFALEPWIGATPFALFHLAVLLATTLRGKAAGWPAVILSLVAANLAFLGPRFAPSLDPRSLGSLGVSALVAAAIVVLVDRIQRGAARGRIRRAEIERFGRLTEALGEVSRTIAWSASREVLLPTVCRVLVERGSFASASIALIDPTTETLTPLASWNDTGEGPAGSAAAEDPGVVAGIATEALADDQACVVNDVRALRANGRDDAPWKRGARAGAAFPIRVQGTPCGVLSVFSRSPGVFQEREVALLDEVAADISLALGHFAKDEERRRAEALADSERELVERVFASVPGVIYLYDSAGRFVRWNESFLTVSGYTAEELAHMQPLDFFRGDDVELVAERIGRVFETGEGAVEAGFVAKDGTSRPYYFTGRRILLGGEPHLVGMGIDISDRVAAEDELRRSQERYRSTLESIAEGCQIIGHDWRYLYVNPAAAVHNRRPSAELIGRTMMECWPGIEGTPAFRLLERCSRERVPMHDEIDFHFPDGHHAWFELSVQPVPEGIFVMSIDATARRQAQAEAEAIQRRFELVVENLREGLVIASPELALLHWNPAALELIGFDDAEVGRQLQLRFGEIFELATLDGSPLPPDRWPLARARAGETFDDVELRVRRRDKPGWERIVSYAGTRVAYGDDRLLAFVTLRDVTERIQAEHALREAKSDLERKVEVRTRELKTALERAEAADRLKSAFLATMSHELRTPLNSIIGFTGIVLQELAGPLNAEQAKQLGMVRGSARHLLDLINDVLDISKIEAGQMEIRPEDVDLRASVERVVATVRPLAERKGLALAAELPQEIPAMRSDRRRVDQILLNLVNNAIKFTDQGAVTLTLESGALADGRAAVQIRVVDTGIGIKPHDLETLFQPFRQVDTGLARQHEGTGLGLAISRRLTELLGGEIRAESAWGVGSTFIVTLPLDAGA